MEHLYEISCGTYQPELARQYVTNMVNLAANANGQNNQSIQLFNQARSQAPVHVPCFFWDQVAPPGNWPAGQRWQPVRILVSNVMHFYLKIFFNGSFEGNAQHTKSIHVHQETLCCRCLCSSRKWGVRIASLASPSTTSWPALHQFPWSE